jgi:simple sugar transport system permease protein
MMINTITLLLGVTLLYSTPMIFGALGGVLSERSGVINIGIEGMMTFGAFAGAAAGYYSGNPWIGVLCAALAGGVLALLHAVAAITCQADQTISGVAINLLGPALAVFFCRLAFDGSTMSYPVANKLPKIFGSGAEGIWANLNVDVMVVVALLFAVAMWFVLYRTKWGMRILAVGENPAAADTLGINVYKTRYACVILSGILAGIGGATVTLGIVAQFTQTSIAGQGFIALAAVIFGKWKPMGAYRACLIFGFSQALTVVLGGGAIAVPTEILAMLPYVLTIVILILFVGKSVAPKADGVPYVKGRR